MLVLVRLTLCAVLFICCEASAQLTETMPKTIEDILVQLKTIQPDSSVMALAAQQANSEPPADADRAALVAYYLERSRADRTLGLQKQMLLDARKAVDAARGMGGDPEWNALSELSEAEIFGGNYLDALKARKQIAESGPGGWSLSGYGMVANLSASLGDIETAESALRAAEQILIRQRSTRAWSTRSSNYISIVERARATVLRAKGKFRDAEIAQRQAIVSANEYFELNRRVQFEYTPQVFLESKSESMDVELSYILMAEGRLREAEFYARGVLQRSLRRVSASSPIIVDRIRPLIDILYLQGRFRESLTLASLAREMLTRSGADPTVRAFASLLTAEGQSLVALGDYSAALERYDQLRTDVTLRPELLKGSYGHGSANWAFALTKSGRLSEAVDMLRVLVPYTKERVGPDHLDTGIVEGELGMALAAQGARRDALLHFQAAMIPLLSPNNLSASPPAVLARITSIVEAYIALLAEEKGTDEKTSERNDAAAEAFRVADAIRGRSIQAALAEATARLAARTSILGNLTRKQQDLELESAAMYEAINTELASPPDQQLPDVIAAVRARLVAIAQEQRALAATIEKDYPAYAKLIRPRPATVDETRNALMPGEALVSVLVTPTASYMWAIAKGGPMSFATSKLTGAEINALVDRLRKSVELTTQSVDRLPPFDIEAGYRLYSELLAPVEPGWRNAKSLLLIVNGALAQIPFALLPMQSGKPAEDGQPFFTELKSVPWLVKHVAITQLPSVNALVTLRTLGAVKEERLPFIGFGDPAFSRSKVIPFDDNQGAGMRNLSIVRPPQEGTETQRSAGIVAGSGPKTVDWVAYETLTPLPDTRDEILAIARALKADPQKDVFFGSDASTRVVKSLDLSRRRVIVFATHGLLPGDMPNLMQPALALAAPVDPKESGLLTLDDILGLKLNADWVILSACNTAAGDGEGAEAISGLGRGFFYAGSRALLVTHWAVETVSARKLVTGIFERAAADPSLSRAEALRQSMLALMDDNAVDAATGRPLFSYAHPIFWAPYALYGDPSR